MQWRHSSTTLSEVAQDWLEELALAMHDPEFPRPLQHYIMSQLVPDDDASTLDGRSSEDEQGDALYRSLPCKHFNDQCMNITVGAGHLHMSLTHCLIALLSYYLTTFRLSHCVLLVSLRDLTISLCSSCLTVISLSHCVTTVSLRAQLLMTFGYAEDSSSSDDEWEHVYGTPLTREVAAPGEQA